MSKWTNVSRDSFNELQGPKKYPLFWDIFDDDTVPEDYLREIIPHCNMHYTNNEYNLLTWLIEKYKEDRAIFVVENTNININFVAQPQEETPLIQACEYGLYRCVRSLIICGANVNYVSKRTRNNVISTLIAIFYDMEDDESTNIVYSLLELIIERAVLENLNMQYDDRPSLLSFYAENDRNEEIKFLLNRCININDEDFLKALCRNGNTEIFFKVISKIDKRIYYPSLYEHESSPLTLALIGYHFDIADKLLELGANVNFNDDNSQSILMKILEQETDGLQGDAVDRLLKYGVDVNFTDPSGRTAIFYANDVNILNKLVLYGANINHTDIWDNSVLYYAICQYRHDLVKAILNFGPDTSRAFDKSNILTENPKLHIFAPSYTKINLKPPAYKFDNLPRDIYECLLSISRDLILSYFGIEPNWNFKYFQK